MKNWQNLAGAIRVKAISVRVININQESHLELIKAMTFGC